MTLSFSLNRTLCHGDSGGDSISNTNDSANPSSSPFSAAAAVAPFNNTVRMIVLYGRGIFPEGRIEQVVADSEHSTHFDFVSPVTGEHYRSDWIQHVTLPNLVATTTGGGGGDTSDSSTSSNTMYWYRIQIIQRQRQDHNWQRLPPSTSSSSYFRPVFLRGSLYKVGESPTYRFLTPPLYHQPTSLALVGDLGQSK